MRTLSRVLSATVLGANVPESHTCNPVDIVSKYGFLHGNAFTQFMIFYDDSRQIAKVLF